MSNISTAELRTLITDPVKIKLLLGKCSSLESKLANLRIRLQVAYKEGTSIIAEPEEILEAMALLNVLSDMPHSVSNPGDKMTNIITEYQKFIDTEYGLLLRDIGNAIFIINSVLERINNGISKLSEEQRNIMVLKYWKTRSWKQIQDNTRLSERQVKDYHQTGIIKLCTVLEIDAKSYDFCMEQLEGKEEKA